MPPAPPVVIYRDVLGAYSETFILAQAAALRTYVPTFLTARFTGKREDLPAEVVAVNRGGPIGMAREYLFRRWGFAPDVDARLRHLRPRLVHAHFGPDGTTLLPLSRRLDIPLVVTFHGYDVTTSDEFARQSFRGHRWYLQRRGVLQREARHFIAVSNFIRERLIAQGFPEQRISVQYIGIDTEQFVADPSVKRERIVLFVGRLVEKKGAAYLIDAMARIQANDPKTELVIIGDGELRPQLETHASSALKRFRFLGPQSPAVVRDWMNRARVFCVPSVTARSGDSEAFGMVFAEAQAMGLPVASFAHGGIPEAVHHGQTGLLAPEGDLDALTAHLQSLLTDETLWNTMSERGPRFVHEQFDIRERTRLLEELYDRVSRSA
jgi:glycosyltransferase involved in cell wall biosynthesis